MQYSSPRGGTPQHSAATSSRTPREQGGRRRAAAGSANAANPRNYTSSVVSVTSPLVRRKRFPRVHVVAALGVQVLCCDRDHCRAREREEPPTRHDGVTLVA